MRLVTTSIIGLLVAAPLLAQEPVTQDRQHVVKKGDTLWDLAGTYLSNPFRWRIIYEANTRVVEDPHWIYPDEVLVIPGLVESVWGTPRPMDEPVVAVQPVERPLRTVFYREQAAPARGSGGATILSEPAYETLPVKPGEFRSAEFLANPSRLPRYGRVIKPKREMHQLRGVTPTAHPKDEIFLTNASDVEPPIGERLLVVNVGRQVSGFGLGLRLITPTAVVEVLEVTPDVIRARVETQFATVGQDQLLIQPEQFPDFMVPEAEPVPGGSDLRGRLVEFVDEQPLYGPTDHGFLDLGSRDGVAVGDVFMAYLPERAARQGTMVGMVSRVETLPPEAVAELRVLRVTDNSATVTVDNLMVPQLQNGIWVQRIRKMP